MNTTQRIAVAAHAARSGATIADKSFRTDLNVETKRNVTDPVTEVDRRAQDRIVDVIHQAYPNEVVIGEETGIAIETASTLPENGIAWIVDPIDGTTNYIHGNPQWTTAVAVVRDREPVAAVHIAPALEDAYVAGIGELKLNGETASVSDLSDPARFVVAPMMGWGFGDREGIGTIAGAVGERFGHLRRYGSGHITLSMIASGQIEGGFTFVRGRSWDRISGAFMVEQAGGIVTDLTGDPWTLDSAGMIASNGAAHDELVATVDDIRTRYHSDQQ